MNGEDAKKLNSTVNKSSAISIGVVIVIVGATWIISASMTSVRADVESVDGDVSALQETISALPEDYVPRRELELMVGNIEAAVLEIKKAVAK